MKTRHLIQNLWSHVQDNTENKLYNFLFKVFVFNLFLFLNLNNIFNMSKKRFNMFNKKFNVLSKIITELKQNIK